MDLSEAFNCIPHELLIAKLKCYGIENGSRRLLLDYLTNRKQRTKIGSSFSAWCDNNTGVPQSHKDQSLVFFFYMFMNTLLFSITKSEVRNFAYDNTLHSCNKKLEQAFSNPKCNVRSRLNWFKINTIKINHVNFQFMVLGVKIIVPFRLNINSQTIPCFNQVKLLGKTIDNKHIFKKHIEGLCKKVCYKLHSLKKIRGYLTVEKARILANAFSDSQFDMDPFDIDVCWENIN